VTNIITNSDCGRSEVTAGNFLTKLLGRIAIHHTEASGGRIGVAYTWRLLR